MNPDEGEMSETEPEYQRMKNEWRSRPSKYNIQGKRDPLERWKECPISGRMLKRPVLSGQCGHLLSAQGAIEFLDKYQAHSLESYDIARDTSPVCDYLHTLSDLIELKLQDNPEMEIRDALSWDEKAKMGDFVCPVTGLETNGEHQFVFSWQCGCVVAKEAIEDENPSMETRKCLICGKPYKPWDLVLINPVTRGELKENQGKYAARSMTPYLFGQKVYRPGDILRSDDSTAIPEWSSPFLCQTQPIPRSDAAGSFPRCDHRSSTPADQPSTSGTSKRNK